MFPSTDFGTLNMKMATERLDWLQFVRKINRQVIRALSTISVTQCALAYLA